MRKGRSSRRSRVSRPLIGSKAPPASADALSTEIGTPANPRVIVGVPTSEPPPASSPESRSPVSIEARGSIDGVAPSLPPAAVDPLAALERLEQLPPSADEDLDDKTNPDLTREERDEKAEPVVAQPEPVVAQPEPVVAQPEEEARPEPKKEDAEPETTKRSFESTMAFGSSAEPRTIDAAPEAKPAAPIVEGKAPEPIEEKAPIAIATRSTSDEQVVIPPAPDTDPDEISVPPIGDVDDDFFSDGDVSRHLAGDALEGDALTIPDKAKRKSEPHVVERRERFVRYVKWAVAGAAVVCMAAVARTTLTAKTSGIETRSVAVATTTSVEAPPAAPKAAVQAAAPITAHADPPAAPAAPVATEAASEVAPAPETTEATAEEVTGDAKEEKTKAQTLLEKRKIADAIEAGERSVKLDPSDGEAWLILGAAYQEKGNMVEARRAYAACVKEAKTGPRSECAKMLR